MNFLNSWLQGIIVAVVIATIIEMIVPNNNSKKYIKIVLGVFVVFNIITPVINQLSKNNFEISSIINIDEYSKKLETYEISSTNIDITQTNEDQIKQVYINNLKTDIKTKLEERSYKVNKVDINLNDKDTYNIKDITIYIDKKIENIENNEKTKNEIEVHINEIETINIRIEENNNLINNENIEKKSTITDKEKKEIKEYLLSTYEIKENQITIY